MFPFRRRPQYDPTQFNAGLWRIWDRGAVIGWVSTDDCVTGWVEVDLAFPDRDPSREAWDQPWGRDVVPIGSEVLTGILAGRVATDLLGPSREFTLTRVEDDEFEQLAFDHYGFY